MIHHTLFMSPKICPYESCMKWWNPKDAVATRAPRAPVWDYHAIRARLEILASFPIRPDDAETGAFQIAPSSVVDFRFRPLTNSDVRSLSCHDIELVRVAHGMKGRFAA